MVADLESREFPAKIYELIRAQQQDLFDLAVKIQSLEMALNTNPSFAQLYQGLTAQVLTPELKTAH